MKSAAINGWVLYDDCCGFCRRWVPFWGPTLKHRGYEIAALQAEWVSDKLKLSQSVLLHDLRLLLANGRQIEGADVYRYFMKRIWWMYPLFLLACAPGLRCVFDWAYRTFARNRFRFSKACGLGMC